VRSVNPIERQELSRWFFGRKAGGKDFQILFLQNAFDQFRKFIRSASEARQADFSRRLAAFSSKASCH